jgi:hypothetical protein
LVKDLNSRVLASRAPSRQGKQESDDRGAGETERQRDRETERERESRGIHGGSTEVANSREGSGYNSRRFLGTFLVLELKHAVV